MSLTYKDIIGNSFVEHTKRTLTNGENLTYYIDQTKGLYQIDRYPVIQRGTIQSTSIKIINIGHDNTIANFIRNSFEKLDKIIDLDFTEMYTNNGSMIDIYHINYSSNFNQPNIIGQALSQKSEAGSWWDIFWKDSQLSGKINVYSDQNTIIHEIGHALGLSHPFNAPENKLYDTSDTVMSYNRSKDGWNNWFTSNDLNALINIWGREDDLGIIKYNEKSSNYKFKKNSDERYFIKTELGLENITNIKTLEFSDKSLEVKEDIIDVFNLIEGKDHITGKIYRLYNAAFARFPDKIGLDYWISKNKLGIDSYRNIASSFILSEEYISLYGLDSSNEQYISNLYENILERSPDSIGYNYWLNQINSGLENRSELLMGFSESTENKNIFINETNFF